MIEAKTKWSVENRASPTILAASDVNDLSKSTRLSMEKPSDAVFDVK